MVNLNDNLIIDGKNNCECKEEKITKEELYNSIQSWMNCPSNFPSNQDKYMLGNAVSYYQQLCKIMKYLSLLGEGDRDYLKDVILTGTGFDLISKTTEDGVETIEIAVSSEAGGTVTDITAGYGLTGGTITESGTIAIDTAVIETIEHASEIYATIESLDDYIVKDDAPGYADILTQTSAATIYETISHALSTYATKVDLNSLDDRVTTNEDDIVDINNNITELDQDIIDLEQGKQDTLVSGTNIKTINNESILGNGNLNIGGAVDSVNGKTGTVILNASDINATNTQSIQNNLERIDTRIDDLDDAKQDALDSTQLAAVNSGITQSQVNRLLLEPLVSVTSKELVGIENGIGNEQMRVQIGDGLSFEGTTSPYILKATSGGFPSIDTTNILLNKSEETPTTYTATENCFATCCAYTGGGGSDSYIAVSVNNVSLTPNYKAKSLMVPLKKDDTLIVAGQGVGWHTIFVCGIKY